MRFAGFFFSLVAVEVLFGGSLDGDTVLLLALVAYVASCFFPGRWTSAVATDPLTGERVTHGDPYLPRWVYDAKERGRRGEREIRSAFARAERWRARAERGLDPYGDDES